jgi:hypothetical protein
MKNLLRNTSAKVFNQRYPVGTPFIITSYQACQREIVVTRSEAWHMRNGRVVVGLKGK